VHAPPHLHPPPTGLPSIFPRSCTLCYECPTKIWRRLSSLAGLSPNRPNRPSNIAIHRRCTLHCSLDAPDFIDFFLSILKSVTFFKSSNFYSPFFPGFFSLWNIFLPFFSLFCGFFSEFSFLFAFFVYLAFFSRNSRHTYIYVCMHVYICTCVFLCVIFFNCPKQSIVHIAQPKS